MPPQDATEIRTTTHDAVFQKKKILSLTLGHAPDLLTSLCDIQSIEGPCSTTPRGHRAVYNVGKAAGQPASSTRCLGTCVGEGGGCGLKHAPKRHQQSCELGICGDGQERRGDVPHDRASRRSYLCCMTTAVMPRRYGCYTFPRITGMISRVKLPKYP